MLKLTLLSGRNGDKNDHHQQHIPSNEFIWHGSFTAA